MFRLFLLISMFLPLHAGRSQAVNLRGNCQRANVINKHVAFGERWDDHPDLQLSSPPVCCILGEAERGFRFSWVPLTNFLPFAPITRLPRHPSHLNISLKVGKQFVSLEVMHLDRCFLWGHYL